MNLILPRDRFLRTNLLNSLGCCLATELDSLPDIADTLLLLADNFQGIDAVEGVTGKFNVSIN